MTADPTPISSTIAELSALWNLPFPQKQPDPGQKQWLNRLDFRIPGGDR